MAQNYNNFSVNDDGTVTRKKKSNATFSSDSSQKGYRIDEYGRVVRPKEPFITNPPRDTTKKEEPEFSFVGCLYILIIIAIIVFVIKFLFLT